MPPAATPEIAIALEIAFLYRWPDNASAAILAYTADVSPSAILDGADNTTEAPDLDITVADAEVTASGYARTGEWIYTDDMWAAIVTPAEGV
jgi:hypothetical protein